MLEMYSLICWLLENFFNRFHITILSSMQIWDISAYNKDLKYSYKKIEWSQHLNPMERELIRVKSTKYYLEASKYKQT